MRLLLLLPIAVRLCAQDPLSHLPKNYSLVFENQAVRVIRVVYQPHEKLEIHDHPATPTVYVYLTDSGPVKFMHAEQRSFNATRPAEKAGTFRFSPGRIERHAVENLGDIRSEFLRVELKQIPLGYPSSAVKASKAFDVSHSGITTEFATARLRIQRVVSAQGEPAFLPADNAPALLVAFSPISVGAHALRLGDVLWVPARTASQVLYGNRSGASYFLQILITAPPAR